MARKTAPPKAPPKVAAKSQRRRFVSVPNPRSWARNRIKRSKLELAMYDAVQAYIQDHQRKLRQQITREEKDLLAPAPVAPDFPMKVRAPARATK